MKLIKYIPKKLFKHKNTQSISRSEHPSFGSGTTSSCSDSDSHHGFKKPAGLSTPTSVLPDHDGGASWSGISVELYAELIHAFHMIDSDGDGKIKKEELEAILAQVVSSNGNEPLTKEELTTLINDVDKDGDGCISLQEFGAINSAFGPPSCDDELKDAFDFFDANHDGKITAEELFNVFRSIGGDGQCTLDDCKRMIRGVDKNGDGFVCFEDFCLMMEQQR